MTPEKLISSARAARDNAYAPYSGFYVGAALCCSDGTVFTGCNIENASYPAGVCAERSALFSAVTMGKRAFEAIAVIASSGEGCVPCGLCLQALSEFCGGDFTLYLCSPDGSYTIKKLSELLPFSFSLNGNKR